MSELFTNYLTDLSDFLAFFVVSLFLVVVFVVVYTNVTRHSEFKLIKENSAAAAVARAAARMAGLRLYSYPVWSRWHDPGFRGRLGAPREYRVDPGPWRAAKRAAIAQAKADKQAAAKAKAEADAVPAPTEAELKAARDAHEILHIKVVGLVRIASDVTPELALATIGSIDVLGALQASPEVKKALGSRIR